MTNHETQADRDRAKTSQLLATLDEFTESYVNAAMFTATLDSESDGFANGRDHFATDIHPDTLAKMIEDCTMFQAEHESIIADNLDMAGYHFWMNRNGHGTGFWADTDVWPESAGELLSESSHNYGQYDLYVGNDGMIHGYPG